MLPWIGVTQNKTQRATLNAVYGAPLVRTYPAGTFFVSNTSGAPGQAPLARIFPKGNNQATDPRGTNAYYQNIGINDSVAASIAAFSTPSVNVGGNSYAAGTSSSNWFLYVALALIAWVIFQEL